MTRRKQAAIALRNCIPVLLSASALFTASYASAASVTYQWDANGVSPVNGGSGTWNASNPFWTSNGGSSYTGWSSAITTTDIASFGATGGTVTLGGPVGANGLTFSAPYTITGGSTTNKLSLSGANPFIDTGGNAVTFSMVAGALGFTSNAANGSITKKGVGILTITNDQSGGITESTSAIPAWIIAGGTQDNTTGLYNSGVAFFDGKELGASTNFAATLDGGMISFLADGNAGIFSARTFNVTANGGAIWDGGFRPGQALGGNTISPVINIAAGAGLNLVSTTNTSTQTLGILRFDTGGSPSGTISGAGGINVYGSGQVQILSTNHTYTGGTNIHAGGSLLIGGAGSLGATTNAAYTLTNAGKLDLNGASVSVTNLVNTGGQYKFKLGANTTNTITAGTTTWGSSPAVIQLDQSAGTTTTNSSYTVVSTTAGSIGSAIWQGTQYINNPSSTEIFTVGSSQYKMTLVSNGTTLKINTAPAPSKTITIMPLGASIVAGVSADANYNGDGFRAGLFQNLVNDGRFNPLFVGSQTGSQASSTPTGTDLLTAVGQTHHEGHPGFTALQIDQNLTAGGNYLTAGNGVNPDYLTVNVGGNDLANQSASPATTLSRIDQLLTDIAADRPNATTVLSDVLYRTDIQTSDANTVNAALPGVVFKHVLAGQHVSFYDWNSVWSYPADLSGDGIHPTQVGYNKLATGWYNMITKGQAFFTGNSGAAWNSSNAGNTSFAMDFQRTTDSGAAPSSITDVYFNGASAGATTLGADFSVRSVNFTSGASSSVGIGGANTLTIGQGGITVQAGTGAHTISSNVAINGAQTWGNVSSNPFTVSGNVAGAGNLTIDGTSSIVLAGNNTYAGITTVAGGKSFAMNTTGSATGAAGVTINTGATLSGKGAVSGVVTVRGTITAGDLLPNSVGQLTTGLELWAAGAKFLVDVSTDGLSNDSLLMPSLSISATPSNKFNIALSSASSTVVPADSTLVLVTVNSVSASNPFFPTTYTTTTQPELNFSLSNLSPSPGYTFNFTTAPNVDGSNQAIGYSLVLSQTAVPEPASLLLGTVIGAGLLLRRRRNG